MYTLSERCDLPPFRGFRPQTPTGGRRTSPQTPHPFFISFVNFINFVAFGDFLIKKTAHDF